MCLFSGEHFFFAVFIALDIGFIYRKPFLKERTSDDSTHADSIISLLTELGMHDHCVIICYF